MAGDLRRGPGVPRASSRLRTLLLRFGLLNECSEMRGDGSRDGVVLVLEALPNRGPQGSSARDPSYRWRLLENTKLQSSTLPDWTIRGKVVRRVDVTLIDFLFRNELVDIDGARALDLNSLYLLVLDNHVLAFGDLVPAHHVVPRDDLASCGIDVLLFQSVARLPIDPIKTHFFAQRRGRIERNGARDQRKPKVALPVRARRHWILLTSLDKSNYTPNFSKCWRPGAIRAIPNIHSIRP